MKNLVLFVFIVVSFVGLSHEIRPAYLQITETGPNQFDVYWRVPSRGTSLPKLQVVFPTGTIIEGENYPNFVDGFANFNYQIQSKESLTGKVIRIEGLKKTMIDVLVRIDYEAGEQETTLLQPDKDFLIVAGETSTMEVIKLYTVLGVEHILIGFDHLLFVLALMLLSKGGWKVVKTVTAFTLAHSITLTLSTLNWVHWPGPPVEATIALSIVFLSFEVIKASKGEVTLTISKPWLVAFSFGLLHGFGFAGVLQDIGIPSNAIFTALAFFNIGVEIGQLIFIAVLFGVYYLIIKHISIPKNSVVWLSYAMGSISCFWMIERLIGFF